MADLIDQAQGQNELVEAAALAAIRNRAQLDPGVPGECERCGDDSPRLVRGACAPCRDKYRLK
jgi:hypothetical protein